MAREGSLVVFSLDQQSYALPLSRVRRAIRVVAPTPLPLAPALVVGIVNIAGSVIPVIDLRKRFHLKEREIRLSDQLLLADTGKRLVALLTDEVQDVFEPPSEETASAAELPPCTELFAGVVKRPDGLILIHDLDRLLSLDEEAALDRALADGPPASPATGNSL